jgi:predicted ribonuclease YlaK
VPVLRLPLLPGDVKSKLDPYMQPLCEDDHHPGRIDRMKEQELFAHVNQVKGERSLAELASTLL